MQRPRTTSIDLLLTAAGLVLLLAWDASGFDLLLARPLANAHGFELRNYWLLTRVFHAGGQDLAWLVGLWSIAGVAWPTGILRRLARRQRVQLTATILLTLIFITVLKRFSLTSCPWDLAEFGGHAALISHWAAGVADGGGGHCFPAGHAAAGFAFIGGYFVLRQEFPQQARLWLVSSLTAGLVLGIAQQLRGAHFMGHTAWTAWICWTLAWLIDWISRNFIFDRQKIAANATAETAAPSHRLG